MQIISTTYTQEKVEIETPFYFKDDDNSEHCEYTVYGCLTKKSLTKIIIAKYDDEMSYQLEIIEEAGVNSYAEYLTNARFKSSEEEFREAYDKLRAAMDVI